jgi:DNA-binding CsgD family transcriptional regulator
MTTPLRELTAREREILALIGEGCSNAAIAQRLWITPKTLESHVGRIFAKLGLPPTVDLNRRVLAALAYDRARRQDEMPLAA